MRRSTLAALVLGIVATATNRAAATDIQPRLGTALGYGSPLLDGDTGRVSTHLHGGIALNSTIFMGGELSGTAEAYMGAWSCGTSDAENIPSSAETCFQPTLAAHGLVGIDGHVVPSILSDLRLGLEIGAGPAVRWLIPSRGGHAVRSYSMSYIARATALLGVLPVLDARWHVGVELEGRSLDGAGPAIGLGLRLDAHVLD